MKAALSLVCLAAVALCVLSNVDQAQAVDVNTILTQMKDLEKATSQFADQLQTYLVAAKINDPQIKDQLKQLGANLGNTEAKLAEQMGALGGVLGLPPPPARPNQ